APRARRSRDQVYRRPRPSIARLPRRRRVFLGERTFRRLAAAPVQQSAAPFWFFVRLIAAADSVDRARGDAEAVLHGEGKTCCLVLFHFRQADEYVTVLVRVVQVVSGEQEAAKRHHEAG